MVDPQTALAAAARPRPRTAASQRRVLVLGGGGGLGSQVVEVLLGGRRFGHVGVWTVLPLQPALRGLEPMPEDAWAAFAPDTAVVVFDRARHANGRDEAFGRPGPATLPALAARLRELGVRVLVVVVPHAPGSLPQALKAGLATLDEGAVAAQGFSHLVFMRPAQSATAEADASAPVRLARWMLDQLQWMVPQRDQPVRSLTVARVAARLATALPEHAGGTRVFPPEALWAAAQRPDDTAVVDAWLAGQTLDLPRPRQRW
jgi:hypothetical protein